MTRTYNHDDDGHNTIRHNTVPETNIEHDENQKRTTTTNSDTEREEEVEDDSKVSSHKSRHNQQLTVSITGETVD